jgi:tetratricopeptide (TPR) repeat protein
MKKRNVKSSGAPPARPQHVTGTLPEEERDRRLYQAVLDYQAGRYDAAEATARELRAAAPQLFPAVLLLGMIAGRTGRAAQGVELLREALALDHRSAEARSELAMLLRAAGRNEEAIAAARHAVRLGPDDAGGYNNLGLCYLAAERLPKATEAFQRAIALKAEVPMFHYNLGLALEQRSRDFEAIAAFRQALALAADHADAHAHLGRLLVQHGQPAEAAEHYRRAAVLQPDVTLAAVHQAEALMHEGRAAQAETCLRAALESQPQSGLAHEALGVLLQRVGRFDEAVASFAAAVQLQPKRVSAYAGLVRGKRIDPEDGHLVESMEALARDRTLAPREHAELHFALGKAYDDLGEYQLAIGHFDRANEIEAGWLRSAGRWFDRRARAEFVERMIATFPAARFARRAAGASDSDLPILIVGMPRSGTTLVEQILSSHPEIGAAGELNYWTDRPPLVGAQHAVPGDARLRELAAGYLALLRTAAPAALRVTDKMPANFLVLGLIHLALPEARIIHCRRDPLDTCLSIYSTQFSHPLDFAHDRANLVFFYQQYQRLMAHWRRVIPVTRLLEIDYETLVEDTETVTRTMIGFCGLDWDAGCLRHERNPHLITTPSVWQARQPVYRGAVGRGRRYRPWLGAFERLAPAG